MRRSPSSARDGCTTSAGCSTRRSRCSRAASSARRSSPRPTTRTRRAGGGEPGQLGHRAGRPATMQLGTHLDALSHLQIGDRGYNGWTRRGARRHRRRDAARRRDGPADRHARLARRRLRPRPRPGDVITRRRRWPGSSPSRATRCSSTPAGARTGTIPSATSPGEPGPGYDVADWLVEHGVALTGCDTWSYGPVPAEDPDRPFEVPQMLNVRPRRLRRREPRHRASSPPTACGSSR